jgi:hypothetical protein
MVDTTIDASIDVLIDAFNDITIDALIDISINTGDPLGARAISPQEFLTHILLGWH